MPPLPPGKERIAIRLDAGLLEYLRDAVALAEGASPLDDGQDSGEGFMSAGEAQNPIRNAGVPPAVAGASRSRARAGCPRDSGRDARATIGCRLLEDRARS